MNNFRVNENVLYKFNTVIPNIIATVIVLFVVCKTLIFSVHRSNSIKRSLTHTNSHIYYIFNFLRAVTTFRNEAPSFPPDDAGNTNV